MAKKRPTKAVSRKPPRAAKRKPDDELPPTTTLQVDRAIADRVRALAAKLNITSMTLTNSLLKNAMDSGKVSAPEVVVSFN